MRMRQGFQSDISSEQGVVVINRSSNVNNSNQVAPLSYDQPRTYNYAWFKHLINEIKIISWILIESKIKVIYFEGAIFIRTILLFSWFNCLWCAHQRVYFFAAYTFLLTFAIKSSLQFKFATQIIIFFRG